MKRSAPFLRLLPLLLPLLAHAAQPECPTISITAPLTLAGATLNDAYTTTLSQSGASSAGFAVSAGRLPGGLSLQPNGTLAGTPSESGDYTFTATATDGASGCSGGRVYVLSVIAVNHAPSFTAGPNQTVLEDAIPQSIAGWASVISAGPGSESGQSVNFIVSNDNTGLFASAPTIAANGTLSYTLATNANGTANVSVSAHDNGGTSNGGVDTSAPQSFSISVTAVNDAPGFAKGADQIVLENAGPQSVANWATAISAGPPDESGQTLNFSIVSNSNPALFSAGPSISPSGTLSYTTTHNASGSASVSVALLDDGGTANGGADTSAAQTFSINVTAVDAPPTAVNDTATVSQDSAATAIDVLANDTDVDGGPKHIASVTQPANGTVVITGGGTGLTYQPNAGYSNNPPTVPADTFSYTLTPGGSTANVAVTVTSSSVDVGAYHLDGTCGVLGVLGPGFTLTAGASPLPVGTNVLITGSNVSNIGVFSVTGGTASVTVLSGTSRSITLTSALPANATMAFRTTLSITVSFTLNGLATLPDGYTSTGGKSSGSVNSTQVLCSGT